MLEILHFVLVDDFVVVKSCHICQSHAGRKFFLFDAAACLYIKIVSERVCVCVYVCMYATPRMTHERKKNATAMAAVHLLICTCTTACPCVRVNVCMCVYTYTHVHRAGPVRHFCW